MAREGSGKGVGEVVEVAEGIKRDREAREVEAPRRRGRPPGSKNKRRDYAAERRARKERSEAKAEPYVRTDEGVAVAGVLGNTVWNLSRMLTGCRALSDDEREELGGALDPVLHKYLPMLDDWKAEATLIMVCWTLYERTRPKEAPKESGAEVIEAGGTT